MLCHRRKLHSFSIFIRTDGCMGGSMNEYGNGAGDRVQEMCIVLLTFCLICLFLLFRVPYEVSKRRVVDALKEKMDMDA